MASGLHVLELPVALGQVGLVLCLLVEPADQVGLTGGTLALGVAGFVRRVGEAADVQHPPDGLVEVVADAVIAVRPAPIHPVRAVRSHGSERTDGAQPAFCGVQLTHRVALDPDLVGGTGECGRGAGEYARRQNLTVRSSPSSDR